MTVLFFFFFKKIRGRKRALFCFAGGRGGFSRPAFPAPGYQTPPIPAGLGACGLRGLPERKCRVNATTSPSGQTTENRRRCRRRSPPTTTGAEPAQPPPPLSARPASRRPQGRGGARPPEGRRVWQPRGAGVSPQEPGEGGRARPPRAPQSGLLTGAAAGYERPRQQLQGTQGRLASAPGRVTGSGVLPHGPPWRGELEQHEAVPGALPPPHPPHRRRSELSPPGAQAERGQPPPPRPAPLPPSMPAAARCAGEGGPRQARPLALSGAAGKRSRIPSVTDGAIFSPHGNECACAAPPPSPPARYPAPLPRPVSRAALSRRPSARPPARLARIGRGSCGAG